MAHTIDHEEEIYKIQRDIEKRHNRVLNTGRQNQPYATKMSLLGNMPGETTSTKGQEIATGLVKSILPNPTDPKEVAEFFVDAKTAMKVPGHPLMKGGAFLGKRAARELLPTLDEVLEPVLRRFRGPQLQPALVDAGTGGIRTQIPTDVEPNTFFKMSAIPNTEMPPGGFARGRNTVERVSDALTGRLKGQEQIDVLRKAVKSGDKKAIYKALNTTFANVLDKKYVDGRRGYYNIKRLVDDPELLTDIVLKQDEIAQAHFKLMKNPKSDALRRDLYEIVGDTYFNNKLVIYGKSKWKDRITDASNWLKDTHWHHIFGNREAAEFMLSSVARDPLVGVNLAKLMNKLDLTAAGVADNLMLMKSVGHNNLHELLRKLGVDPNYGRMGPADFADFSHAISEIATKGHRYGDKMGDLAGKFVPPDPSYVNELFGMVEAYSKANKAWRKLIESGGVWYDPNLRRIVPKGTKGAKFYDFTLSKTGKSKKPEVLGKRIQNLLKILEEG